MAGGPTIVAQGVPAQIVSFPNWSLPTRVRLVADIVAGAAVVRAADTTPGLLCSNGVGGVFDITFPAAQRQGDFNPQVYSTVPGTAVNRFFGVVDVNTTNTNATTGKLRVVTASTGAAAIPNDGAVVDVSWYIDYGK
jgi:hypothetical protein